jgi:flagellar biosynthesis/type III secretory pathway protein FliH
MTTIIQQIIDFCELHHIPFGQAEELSTAVANSLKQRMENARIEGYEQGKQEGHDKGYTEGYDEGERKGRVLGATNILEEISNDVEIEEDTRTYIHTNYKGGE